MHYKKLSDHDFLGAWDLEDENGEKIEMTLTIAKVERGAIASPGTSKKQCKGVISFVGQKKRMALNATNGDTIANLYGTNVKGWAGKRVTLYQVPTQFGKRKTQGIRVKPQEPGGRVADAPAEQEPAYDVEAEFTREPGERPADVRPAAPQPAPATNAERPWARIQRVVAEVDYRESVADLVRSVTGKRNANQLTDEDAAKVETALRKITAGPPLGPAAANQGGDDSDIPL